MTANPQNILAGIAGLGDAFELAWFADSPASSLPTDTSTALSSAFKSAGIVDASGVDEAINISTTDITSFGSFSPTRTLVTSEVHTFKLVFQETNPVVLALKSRQSLASVSPTGGKLSLTEGPARDTLVAAVFHAVDGNNVVRKVVPSMRLTARDDEQIQFASGLVYGLTFTAYPDAAGNTIYTYYDIAGWTAS